MGQPVGANIEAVKPVARPIRDLASFAPYWLRARAGHATSWTADPPVFVLGCGRSGTTLLGELLGRHPRVWYLFEPRERWAAVTRTTDVALAFSRGGARCFMTADDAGPRERRAFARVLQPDGGRMLVEKSPVNSLRIGFLDALAPDARFVHIVRDGVDVTRSIALRSARTRRVIGRGMVNDWWGSNDSKWRLLESEGAAAGYYPDEAPRLASNSERGAYEWLVSLGEIDRRRPALGHRLHEITYQSLIESPGDVLAGLADFLQLDGTDSWIRSAAGMVAAPERGPGEPLSLPKPMADDFNGFQRRYGFAGRAVSSVPAVDDAAVAR